MWLGLSLTNYIFVTNRARYIQRTYIYTLIVAATISLMLWALRGGRWPSLIERALQAHAPLQQLMQPSHSLHHSIKPSIIQHCRHLSDAGKGKCFTNYRLRPCVRASAVHENGSQSPSSSVEYVRDTSTISHMVPSSPPRQVFADQIGANLQLQRRAIISWPNGPPQRVLIVKKAGSRPAAQALHTLATWCGLYCMLACLHHLPTGWLGKV